jgi:hypothetical protein
MHIYSLYVVDEYSRFPFAFPCQNMESSTVIMCLNQLFRLCGMPNYIHSDLGTSFLSRELKDYLTKRGIATSRTTPYHPIGNGQVERYNGIIWKANRLALRSANLPDSRWELVLAHALHSIRSLLCTSTNATPHKRFFNFHRRSSYGVSLPSWMQSGPVLLRRFVRTSKNDPLVDEVELTDVNPTSHVYVTLMGENRQFLYVIWLPARLLPSRMDHPSNLNLRKNPYLHLVDFLQLQTLRPCKFLRFSQKRITLNTSC